MAEVLLDTNFILSCINQRIDFFEELELMGHFVIIPSGVLLELENIADSKKKMQFRENATLALKLLKGKYFKRIRLGDGHTDDTIVEFLNKNPDVILATLDKELKKRVKARKIVIKSKKKIEFE